MTEIFLSYARSDGERVDPIYQRLVQSGYGVFRDVDGILPGERWADVLGNAVRSAKVVLAFFSKRSVQSEWVRAEASIAQNQGRLLPILLDDIELPLGFSHIQFLDFTKWTGTTSEREWQLLLRAINTYLGRSPVDEALPLSERPGTEIVHSTSESYPRVRRKLVFIAHASADKKRIRPLLEVLVDAGFRVWIDKPYECGLSKEYLDRLAKSRIQYGADWKEAIRKAIKKADRLLAFWSEDAVLGRREQFQYEVYQGLVQNKLRQCRIDKLDYTEIGFPYTFHHIADLSDVRDTKFHPAFRDLVLDIESRNVTSF